MAGVESTYTQETADRICELISSGKTLTWICRQPDMPGRRTVGDWRRAHPDFDAAYKQAQEDGCHALLDETLEIADDREEDSSSRKIQIWARHELIKRKRPDLFSDKVALEHTGKNGGPVETFTRVERRVVRPADRDG